MYHDKGSIVSAVREGSPASTADPHLFRDTIRRGSGRLLPSCLNGLRSVACCVYLDCLRYAAEEGINLSHACLDSFSSNAVKVIARPAAPRGGATM